MRENDLLDIELRIQRAARMVELLGGDKQFVECAEELLHEMKRLSDENEAQADALKRAAGHLASIDACKFSRELEEDEEDGEDKRNALKDDADFEALAAILEDYAE